MMTVREALCVTRDKNSSFDEFLDAISYLCVFSSLENGTVNYYSHETNTNTLIPLTKQEIQYIDIFMNY